MANRSSAVDILSMLHDLPGFHCSAQAGSWPTRTRPVLDKVSQGFAIFFVFYITVIAFALIRIITAIFLKDTLDAANNDAELQIMENMTRREKRPCCTKCLILQVASPATCHAVVLSEVRAPFAGDLSGNRRHRRWHDHPGAVGKSPLQSEGTGGSQRVARW